MQWDEDKGSLRVVQRERLGQLVLREQPQARPSDAVMAQAMLDWISEQGLGVLTWEREAVQLRQRLLDWPLRQRLDSQLPSHYTVPTGSGLPLRYQQGEPPVLAVRMQEMFGEQQTPRVAVVLELLSPAHRPLQITRDLAAFWRGAYREVQKEMKGRYPKHPWPDDPARALPTRRARKTS